MFVQIFPRSTLNPRFAKWTVGGLKNGTGTALSPLIIVLTKLHCAFGRGLPFDAGVGQPEKGKGVRKGVSPGYCRIGHHFFKQFATVCRQPIRNRCAIQSIVITLSALNRAASFTLTASVFRRPSKSSSVHPRFFNSPATKRSAFCSSVSCFSTPP